MRILLVEDNELSAEVTALILRTEGGHEVVTARTAEEALTRRVLWRPDVVLLDLLLPGRTDPLDFLLQLRATSAGEGLPHVPVVITTGLGAREIEAVIGRALEEGLGPVTGLRKPIDPQALLSLLESLRPRQA
jgi:CheY-like chemotaxis protein